MLQIVQVTFDASVALKRREAFPFLFPDRDTAALFLESHLETEFTDGRSGYDRDDDRWWGCDDKRTSISTSMPLPLSTRRRPMALPISGLRGMA